MELFNQTKEGWFRGFLSQPHGIPSDDTFRRVFEKINPKKFQQHFMDWVKAVEKLTRGQVIAIDGKTVKGTRHSKQKAIHIVSAWASENKVVLGQLKTDEKSNEITAIPQLLDLLSVSGCIVTIDAMGCQTEIAQKIIDEEGDYLLAVKKNQGHLYEDIEWLFKLTTDINYAEDGFDQAKTVDKRHGRLEVRQCWVITDSEWLTYVRDRHRWPQLCGVVKVAAKRDHDKRRKPEVRYYITSCPISAERLLAATRH